MTLKIFLIRFAGLALFTLLGGLLFAIVFNLMIKIGLTPSGEGSEGFGKILTQQTVFIYMASILAGFAGIFVKENWRWILYLCPLYAPSLFAFIYTIIHR